MNISHKIEDIKNNIFRFNSENGHFPSAREIDGCPYLPSSRSLQRSHGGLIAVRKAAGLPDDQLNLTKGKPRADIATVANHRADEYEGRAYKELVALFGEVRVHREFPFMSPSKKNRCDFYVYNRDGTRFMCDMFFAKDRHNFLGCLNHKMRKHKGDVTGLPTYFVSMNGEIDIMDAMKKKKIKLDDNWKIINYKDFIREIKEKFL